MPKIPKVTAWTRFTNFIRGLLLYNTVYWSRASDGLQPPKVSRDERRQLRPVRDLSMIQPRIKPRAKLESEAIAEGVAELPSPLPVGAGTQPLRLMNARSEGRRKSRKRRKHKHQRLSPMDAFAVSTGGVLNKIFGRKKI